MADGYCLKGPDGTLYGSTFEHADDDRDRTASAWCAAFDFLSVIKPEWHERYWKREGQFRRAARRAGWDVVPVVIVEAHPSGSLSLSLRPLPDEHPDA